MATGLKKLSLLPLGSREHGQADPAPSRQAGVEFHLVAIPSEHDAGEPALGGSPGTITRAGYDVTPVPNEPCRALWGEAGAAPAAETGCVAVSSAPILEPVISQHHQLRLALLHSGGDTLRVNGAPVPSLALLRESDILQWSEEVSFRVAIFHRPNLGPPSPEWLGVECTVCRVPFAENSRCYTCPCGLVLHCEEAGKDGLQCAVLRAEVGCPKCRRPIALQEGYQSLPEVGNE